MNVFDLWAAGQVRSKDIHSEDVDEQMLSHWLNIYECSFEKQPMLWNPGSRRAKETARRKLKVCLDKRSR